MSIKTDRGLGADARAFANAKEWKHDGPAPHACFCIGPQNGDPACPCAMRRRFDGITAEDIYGHLMNLRDQRSERRKKREEKK